MILRKTAMLWIVGCTVVLACGQVYAEAISVNLFSNRLDMVSSPDPGPSVNTAVGSNVAGVVPVGNWNDIPARADHGTPATVPTSFVLKDSAGVATTLSLDTRFFPNGSMSYYESAFCNDNTAFSGAGDNAMMRSYGYSNPAATMYLVMPGTVPYDNFDLYVYFNGYGSANNLQYIRLIRGSTVLLDTLAWEMPEADTSYVLAHGNVPDETYVKGNYVKISGLRADMFGSELGDSLVIAATTTEGYGMINGFQIVNVPEPGTLALLTAGLIGLLAYAWRKRR